MVLSKETYLKKYVGRVNTRLTNAYKKRGNAVAKGQTLVKKYDNVFAIKRGNDNVGYLVDNKVYASKTKGDRRRKSSQKWEKKGGKANCCPNPDCNCNKSCGAHANEEKKGGKANCCSNPNCNCGKKCRCQQGGRGCSNPNCNCGKKCRCQQGGRGCSNPNCNCGKKCRCQQGGRGCSNPNCNCGKGCGCQDKPKNGGSRKFNKNCGCMEGFDFQRWN